jgi:hypothetical protein
MRKCWLVLVLLLIGVSAPAAAQTTLNDLLITDLEIIETTGLYGEPVTTARGVLTNTSDQAFTQVSLYGEALDAGGAVIGEGFGTLVDACDAGLVFDFALQPGDDQPFTMTIERFEQDAVIDHVEVTASGLSIAPLDLENEDLPAGITHVDVGEFISVEWNGVRALRYAEGCRRQLFTEWTWRSYNRLTNLTREITHPRADRVTDDLRTALRLTDEADFLDSKITFDPEGARLVYEDRLNTVFTAAEDGRLIRTVHFAITNRTLGEIHWLANGNFLAAYYGAYGDPVLYFTADAEARTLSPGPTRNRESVIVPGASLDGRRVVLAGTFDDVTGYYLHVVTNGFFELLFELEPPGNNYPSPVPILSSETNLVTRVYVAREVDGQAILQCFNREEGVVHDLAPLPLRLTQGERAQWWLSPDQRMLALAANGANGGLWLIELDAFDCGAGTGDGE